MEKLHYIRPDWAKQFQSCERTRLDLRVLPLEKAVGVTFGAQRPLKFSCYDEAVGSKPTKHVICGGTVRLLGGKNGDPNGGNRIGIAVQDHVAGQMTDYYTSGLFAFQSDTVSANILGKTAYYIVETGKVTDVATGLGTTKLAIGVFQSEAYSRMERPNTLTYGTMFVDVLVNQTYDNSSIGAPTISESCVECNSSCCDLYANPTIERQTGLLVDFAANAINGNPQHSIGSISWNFDGAVTVVGDTVSFEAQGFGENVSFEFPSAGTYSDVYVIVKIDKGDGNGCDCASEDPEVAPCCVALQLEVVVTATTAEIVSCTTVEPLGLQTFNAFKSYTKTDAGVTDTVDGIEFDATPTEVIAGDITTAGQAALKTAIEDGLTAAGFVFAAVIVNVTQALDDGEAQSLSVTVVETDADLKDLKITINGGSSTAVFSVV